MIVAIDRTGGRARSCAVVWTDREGVRHEWHYARRDIADAVAAGLRRGWRSDARVETIT